MEASSRQLKFMQFAYTIEVDLTLKAKQMSEMKEYACNPSKKFVVESDDEVEFVKEPFSEESKEIIHQDLKKRLHLQRTGRPMENPTLMLLKMNYRIMKIHLSMLIMVNNIIPK